MLSLVTQTRKNLLIDNKKKCECFCYWDLILQIINNFINFTLVQKHCHSWLLSFSFTCNALLSPKRIIVLCCVVLIAHLPIARLMIKKFGLYIPVQYCLVIWITFNQCCSLLLEWGGEHCREGSSIVHVWMEKWIFWMLVINVSFQARNLFQRWNSDFTQEIYSLDKLEGKAVKRTESWPTKPSTSRSLF